MFQVWSTGLQEKLGFLKVGSFLESYSKHFFYYAKLILGDVSFSAFKGSSFMVSGKQCSYESYNAGAV